MDFCSEISFFFILLPHPGCCSHLPTAPVVSILDSSTRDMDPAILLAHIYIYACMLSSVANSKWCHPLDDAGLYSASGASSFTCAYCQASPAALVPSPSPVASLSTWNHLISSRTDGDTNFPRVHVCFYPCFSISRKIDPRLVLVCEAKCEQKYLGWSLYSRTVLDHVLYLA